MGLPITVGEKEKIFEVDFFEVPLSASYSRRNIGRTKGLPINVGEKK